MGAINQSSAVYLSISNGLLCRRVQEPTKASVTRVSENNGKTYHEEFYKGWSGKITDIQTRDSQFGKEWCVTINDGSVTAILSFKYSSGYARSFLKCLPNIDLSKDVTITPKSESTIRNGKEEKKTTIFVNQNGPIKWAYTKDNPNGRPNWKTMKVKGVEVNDDTEMMEFLEQMVKTKFAAAQVETEDDVPF